jgi:hypothetical protein
MLKLFAVALAGLIDGCPTCYAEYVLASDFDEAKVLGAKLVERYNGPWWACDYDVAQVDALTLKTAYNATVESLISQP